MINNIQVTNETGIEISYSYIFEDPQELVYFAFCLPWSYKENQVITL